MTDLDKPLWGARSIAKVAYGDGSKRSQDKVYRHAQKGRLARKVDGRLVSTKRVILRDLGLAS